MSITNQYVNILKKLNILYIEDEENIKLNVKKTLLLFSDNVFDAEDIASAKKSYMKKELISYYQTLIYLINQE